MSHQELLIQAKQNQINDLKTSLIYSKQLANSLNSIIQSNSSISNSLIDKITTIHQLNGEIDRQLNQDISVNYTELIKYKQKLSRVIKSCNSLIYKLNNINQIQKNVELIDQDLRILEQTLILVKQRDVPR
ncbi:hypothetical protein JA1_000781 [Spathaspora sp. JA1]|nr:hypothetical protein JA1_000781 [Spathaspora sp. JA1]